MPALTLFFALDLMIFSLPLFYTGAMTAGVFIVIAGYMKTPTLAIASMCVAGAGNGLVYAGFQVNMLDVAPRNASVLMGICNAIANTAGFLSPMLVGFITRNKVGLVLMLSRTKISLYARFDWLKILTSPLRLFLPEKSTEE